MAKGNLVVIPNQWVLGSNQRSVAKEQVSGRLIRKSNLLTLSQLIVFRLLTSLLTLNRVNLSEFSLIAPDFT